MLIVGTFFKVVYLFHGRRGHHLRLRGLFCLMLTHQIDPTPSAEPGSPADADASVAGHVTALYVTYKGLTGEVMLLERKKEASQPLYVALCVFTLIYPSVPLCASPRPPGACAGSSALLHAEEPPSAHQPTA